MKKISLILAAFFVSVSIFAANTDIRLNSIGYRLYSAKKASIASASVADFYVCIAPSGPAIMTGTAASFGTNPDTSEAIWIADFSQVSAAGSYFLSVPGVGNSCVFTINNNVFSTAFYTVFRGFYLWRCGTAVTGDHYYQGVTNTYAHTACHTNDGYDYNLVWNNPGPGMTPTPFLTPTVKRNSTKGWHDAGDYNKYVVNAGVTFGVLGKAWEYLKPNIEGVSFNLPAAPAYYPEYLRELKWETDWLLTMRAPGGRVYHKLSAQSFCCDWTLPQGDTQSRFFVSYSTAAAADFIAMMAQAYRLFLPYDSAYATQCLAAARVSYGRITTAPDNVNVDSNQAGFSTGTYDTGGEDDQDDRIWAAAEMWESTGEAVFLADFENRANSEGNKITDMSWADVRNLGMFTYYLSSRTGKSGSLVNSIRNSILSQADYYANNASSHGYGRVLGTQYWWGVNGAVACSALTLYVANRISPDEKYVDAANDALNYLFGRNYNCRSMVTGLGFNATLYPHDRRSANDGIALPWPGYLAGGPQSNAASWNDIESNYTTNEIAINWNAPLTFALAWLKDAPIFPTPTITGTPPTATASPTISETHTITPTWTITQTHTITPTPSITPTEIFGTLEIKEHFTWPNPSRGAPIKFLISNVGFIETAKIRIFTFSDRKVGEVEKEGMGTSVCNEMEWNPSFKLGNGLYYYILEARGKNTALIRKQGAFVVLQQLQ
jgi:endoglucanase